MFVAAPALVETYAVLTRLPPPHRLSSESAIVLLEGSFMRGAKVVTLDGKSYCSLLRSAPADGIAGGRTYDAVIAACAARAKVKVLLTFNEAHFLEFSDRVEIVVP
jgi:predicted nucleic acid-binding protein